jgi:hypothetical protein
MKRNQAKNKGTTKKTCNESLLSGVYTLLTSMKNKCGIEVSKLITQIIWVWRGVG